MSTKRFKQILPTSKFALSTEEDTYTSVPLDGDMREIPEVETNEDVLSDEVFEKERENGTKGEEIGQRSLSRQITEERQRRTKQSGEENGTKGEETWRRSLS